MRRFSMVAALAMLLVACAGGDGEAGEAGGATTVGSAAVSDGDQSDPSDDSGPDTSKPAEDQDSSEAQLDPTDLPNPGEARIVVDGQTLTFTPEGCDVDEAGFALSAFPPEGEGWILQAFGNKLSEGWSVSLGVAKTGGDPDYTARDDDVDLPTIEGSTVVVEGDFSLRDGTSVGRGLLVANCG